MHLPTDLPAERRLAAYTPGCLTTEAWSNAREPVVAAVLAARPTGAEDAEGLVSRLCQLLAGHSGWDPRTVPDLTALVTDVAIAVHLTRLGAAGKSGKTRENHRADLRRIARALAGTMSASGDPAPRRTRTPAGLGAGVLLLGWLNTGQPVIPVVVAWEQATGRRAATALPAVIAALCAARAPGIPPGTVAALSAACAPTRMVSPRTWTSDTATDSTAARRPTANVPAHVPAHVPAPSTKPVRPAKPLSRTAGLRLARAAHAALTAPTVTPAPDPDLLPAAVRDAVATYRPAGMVGQRWEALAPLCRRLVVGFNPPSANSARNAATILITFLTWADTRPSRAAAPALITAEELRTIGLVAAYLAQLDAPARSLATYRSVLRRALRALDPSPALVIAYQPVAGPYSPAECAAFVRLARNQPTGPRRRELSAIVGLGLGAGLDGRDLRTLSPTDITDLPEVQLPDGTVGLLVTVRGARPRQVPVRLEYVALVREAMALHAQQDRTDTTPLVGLRPDRRNVTSSSLARAVTATSTGVDVIPARLRSTWLVACLSADVPLRELLHAAGLRSARTLIDLLPYCPPPDPERVTALLAMLSVPAPVVAAGGAG